MLQMGCVVSHGLTLNCRGKFVTWLKKADIGRKDNYYGGYTIWVSGLIRWRLEKHAREGLGTCDNGITAYNDEFGLMT